MAAELGGVERVVLRALDECALVSRRLTDALASARQFRVAETAIEFWRGFILNLF